MKRLLLCLTACILCLLPPAALAQESANPAFTVQYYAWLQMPAQDGSTALAL